MGAEVAGEGTVHGPLAGQIAANNMAKDYYRGLTESHNSEVCSSRCLSPEESLAVWRTDECFRGVGHTSSNASEKSALSRVGINALCVGQCDSEIYGTHGFWWTNQSYQMKRMTRRRRTNSSSTADEIDNARRKAVYGSGIVFYLDRAGAIRGIMVWGLPFTNNNAKDNSLNERLVQRMKKVILTNGEIMVKEHTSVIMEKQLDPEKLQVAHLSEESRILASMAVSSTTNTSQSKIAHNSFRARPLYRYINPKPVSFTSLGRLKRNEEIGYGSTGEDIFSRNDNVHEKTESYIRHPSLVYYYSMDWGSGDYLNQSENDEDQEYDARPPKEEPLWKRKSEANKSLSVSDVLSDMFMQNIRKGQFSDGTDAVKQAPTPAIFQDARGVFDDWTSTNGSKEKEKESDNDSR